ncbi:MAG: apolipoprotein N-acyltransferase [Actinobacteria bacterium]|nr:apolipoprotein N-acyltransferase [Actinomycetota bacterium]
MSEPTALADETVEPDDAMPPSEEALAVAGLRRFVRRPLVQATAAGLLLAGSLPPWGFWPLAFGAVVLLDRLLADAPWRRRLSRGAVAGLALFAPTISWITQLTPPGYVVATLAFAGLTGLFLSAVPPGAGRRPGLVGAWVLCEGLRMAWPFGGVPLSLLAVGQVAGPLAGIARVGGVLLIAAATVLVGLAISAALSHQVRVAAAAGVAVVALVVVAAVAPHGEDTGRTVDIAFVQGGGEQGTRAINTDRRKVFERHLDASAEVPDGMDLVLWPENVVDTDFDVQDAKEGVELQRLARRLAAPLLVGTVEGVDDEHFRNSQQALDAEGNWGDRYVKVQRVPFGEWVPFRHWIEKVAPDTLARRDATVSHQSGLMHTAAAPLAVVISWEVFFGHRARSGVRAGGELVYNPTNGSTYTGTLVQTQQIASSRLRAIETGRWLVQVAPTGFSAFVEPDGTVHQRTGTRERAVRVRRDVALRTGETWYVRWGDRPARVLGAGLLAGAWVLALADDRRRRRGEPDDGGAVDTVLVTGG